MFDEYDTECNMLKTLLNCGASGELIYKLERVIYRVTNEAEDGRFLDEPQISSFATPVTLASLNPLI